MRNRLGAGINADHRGGLARQERATVAFAARCIEHPAAVRQARSHTIAMPVLVPDRAAAFRRKTFAGKNECCVGSGQGIQSLSFDWGGERKGRSRDLIL